MMESASCPTPNQANLNHHLFHEAKAPDDLRHLIVDISRACKYISYAIQTTEAGLAGSVNNFGEKQLKLDVLSNDIVKQYLCESHLVSCYASEEEKDYVELHDSAPYSVVFDPLDGSSLVDANFAIGSIFGIYPSACANDSQKRDLVGRTPSEQVAALYTLYGPRTILVYSTGNGVHEFLLNDVGEYVLLRENLQVSEEATNYSPGNLRAVTDNPAYSAVLTEWLNRALTLRYSGCMVADIHHIISKGQGVFSNVGGSKYPEGKLRHVFECGPFAYLIEQAGGTASDGTQAILKKPITDIDQRTPLIIGSKKEVENVANLLTSAA
jgi:fructose-1,6-bisphosphatase I